MKWIKKGNNHRFRFQSFDFGSVHESGTSYNHPFKANLYYTQTADLNGSNGSNHHASRNPYWVIRKGWASRNQHPNAKVQQAQHVGQWGLCQVLRGWHRLGLRTSSWTKAACRSYRIGCWNWPWKEIIGGPFQIKIGSFTSNIVEECPFWQVCFVLTFGVPQAANKQKIDISHHYTASDLDRTS